MTSIPPDNQGRLERISTDRGLSMERQKTDFELERRSPPSESESPLRGAIANLLATERRETDRRLMVERRKSDDLLAARDSLLAVVSHDLRGLLAANEMYLEALRSLDVPLTSPKATAITDAMKDINAAMSRLLGDLLDAASIDCGKLLLTKKPTEIGPILRSVVGAFATGAAAKHIDLALECTGTTCP
ncbi:MAG TPA: histidine kinase dimerization/phospho-acceptor domain-containing protein, partial [Polyangia bacterium]